MCQVQAGASQYPTEGVCAGIQCAKSERNARPRTWYRRRIGEGLPMVDVDVEEPRQRWHRPYIWGPGQGPSDAADAVLELLGRTPGRRKDGARLLVTEGTGA